MHFFELHLDRLPGLQLDHREIVAAQLFSPDERPGAAVTGPVMAYLERYRFVLTEGAEKRWSDYAANGMTPQDFSLPSRTAALTSATR